MPLNPKTYTVQRYVQTVVSGVVTETLDSTFTVDGNLQPMSDGALANQPDGFRALPGRKWTFFTGADVALRPGGYDADDAAMFASDRIVINADTEALAYVHGFKDWSEGLIPGKYWFCVEPETESGRA